MAYITIISTYCTVVESHSAKRALKWNAGRKIYKEVCGLIYWYSRVKYEEASQIIMSRLMQQKSDYLHF